MTTNAMVAARSSARVVVANTTNVTDDVSRPRISGTSRAPV
jgi:hypothetical protein